MLLRFLRPDLDERDIPHRTKMTELIMTKLTETVDDLKMQLGVSTINS